MYTPSAFSQVCVFEAQAEIKKKRKKKCLDFGTYFKVCVLEHQTLLCEWVGWCRCCEKGP